MDMRRVFIDVDAKQVKGISLGSEVVVTLRGAVCELRNKEDYVLLPCGCMGDMKPQAAVDAKSRKAGYTSQPSSMGIKVKAVSVQAKGSYAEMADDDDEEDEES